MDLHLPLTLAVLLLGGGALHPAPADAAVLEDANPFPKFRGLRQRSDDNTCWAVSASAILYHVKGVSDRVCEVVGRTFSRQCCIQGNLTAPECNKAGHTANALRAYGLTPVWSPVDFERAFSTLKGGGLVSVSMDVSNATFGKRSGHSVTIYRAKKYSDGTYLFYVSDSGDTDLYYTIDTGDLTRNKNGKYGYISLARSFDWESMLLIRSGALPRIGQAEAEAITDRLAATAAALGTSAP